MKDSNTIKAKSTVILTRKKMEAAQVSIRVANNGDIHFELPQMSKEQQEQLDSVWGKLYENLIDISITPSAIETTITAAAETLAKETNARIIASLL